jgi:H+/Cl- antiporter ClcA
MEKWKKIAAHIGAYPAALAKWLAVGALIGGIGGVIGSLFHIGVNYATQMRAAHPWILYLLPVLGLIIVGLYRVTKVEGKDTNAVIESVHFGKNVPVLLVPVIFISTVLTHLGGGSAGREPGASSSFSPVTACPSTSMVWSSVSTPVPLYTVTRRFLSSPSTP